MIAIFDLDHTFIRANSSFRFGAFLFRRGKIPFFPTFSVAIAYGLHKLNLLSVEQLHHFAFRRLFLGKGAAVIRDEVELFLDQNLHLLLNSTIHQRFLHFKNEKAATFLYSSSPDFLVEAISARLGFDDFFSSQYLVDKEGNFDRISQLVTGDKKERQLQSVLRQYQNRETTAFSDSILDAPLLLQVDKPVCVNPDKHLRRLAQRFRWEIIEDGCSIQCDK